MLRWAFKKFFWSMVFSAGFMVVVQMSPLRDKFNGSMAKQFGGIKAGAQRMVANHAPDGVKNALLPSPESRSGIITTAELKDTLGEKQTVSNSSNEYVINNENYVLIQGKYYKARPDNTYMVNGEKVFYVSKRSERGKDQPSQTQGEGSSPKIEMPTNPAEMMKILNEAQENMKKRNEMMKELEKTM